MLLEHPAVVREQLLQAQLHGEDEGEPQQSAEHHGRDDRLTLQAQRAATERGEINKYIGFNNDIFWYKRNKTAREPHYWKSHIGFFLVLPEQKGTPTGIRRDFILGLNYNLKERERERWLPGWQVLLDFRDEAHGRVRARVHGGQDRYNHKEPGGWARRIHACNHIILHRERE